MAEIEKEEEKSERQDTNLIITTNKFPLEE